MFDVILGIGAVVLVMASSAPGDDAKQPAKRQNRWVLNLSARDGMDYVKKLGELKAAIAWSERVDKYLFVEDLNRPTPMPMALAALQRKDRLFLRLDDEELLEALQEKLKLKNAPSFIWAGFPPTMEKELLRAELAHANLTEDQINERDLITTFDVSLKGDKYAVKILSQKPRRQKD